jgi:hypothetical protein
VSFCFHLALEWPASLAEWNSEEFAPWSWNCLSVQRAQIIRANLLA